MLHTDRNTQVYSPFGSGYVAEDHGHGNSLGRESNKVSSRGSKWALILISVMLTATTAGAITASKRTYPCVPKLWQQDPPSILKLPGAFGLAEGLF